MSAVFSGTTSPADRLEPAKGFNGLLPHRVRVHTVTDIDELCSLASPRPTKGPAELVVPSVAPTLVVVAVAVAVAWFGLFGRRASKRGGWDGDRGRCRGGSCEVGQDFDC